MYTPKRTHVHLLDKRFSLACQQRYGASALPGVQVSRAGEGGGEERAGEKGGVGVAHAAEHLLPDASESPGLRAGSIQLSLKVTRRLLAASS